MLDAALAVVETTASTALERGCRPADVTVIRSRLADLANAVSALSDELAAIANAAERL